MDYPVYCGQERAGTVRLTEEPGRVRAELRRLDVLVEH